MRKYLVIVAVLVSIVMQAQPISEQQAHDRVVKFLNTNAKTRGHRAAVGTDAERRAVATLMRYCGQAAKMGYGPDGSASFQVTLTEKVTTFFS